MESMADRHFHEAGEVAMDHANEPRSAATGFAMNFAATFSDLLTSFAHQPVALVLLIIAATFVLEDVATVTVALLAARMVIDGPTAAAALVAGTLLGDLALYAAARWAGHYRPVARLLSHPAAVPAIDWLRRHSLAMVVIARFAPGLRLPIYAGAGSIGMPFGRFATAVGLSTLVWTPGLYLATRYAGAAGLDRMGALGWVTAAALALAVVVAAPRIVRRATASSWTPARACAALQPA